MIWSYYIIITDNWEYAQLSMDNLFINKCMYIQSLESRDTTQTQIPGKPHWLVKPIA